MINLKFVGILAAFGFLLSFVLGLLGDVTFGYVILRAVISALVSGGTAALVSFVFRKFLSENAAEASAVRSSPSTGNIVDIRVDEEPLPDTDNSPDFFVSQAYSSASNDAFPYAQQAKQTAPAQAAEPVKPTPAAEFKAAPLGNVASSNAGPAPAPEKKPEPKAEPFVPKPLVQKEAPAAAETTNGPIAALDPPLHRSWIASLSGTIASVREKGFMPVIMCPAEARLLVKKSTEREIPNLVVISASEIAPDIHVEMLGEIKVERC